MQVDVELALIDASTAELFYFQSKLPVGFYVEDKSDRGWGLVIRTTRELPDDFSNAVDTFLEPLSSLAEVIGVYDGLLRIGVFYDTATCTMRLNSYDRLADFKLPLEITAYPSSDEED